MILGDFKQLVLCNSSCNFIVLILNCYVNVVSLA